MVDVSAYAWVRDIMTSGPVISAVVGLIGVVVGSRVQWGIEKRRSKLQYRREQLSSWRKAINSDFDQKGFSESEIYSMLKPYLSKQLVKDIESIRCQGTHFLSLTTGDPIRLRLLDEIARLEKKWGLI
jgi:hypothetical protein